MKICFFGSYDINYSKNIVLRKGFKKKGVEIINCFHPNYFTFGHYPSLFRQFVEKGTKCDVIFVAFFGHYDVWFAWLLAKIFRKKLVFDPLISIYNTRIEDRKYFSKTSLRAKFYILMDKINCSLSDKVFIDTQAHKNYFKSKFNLKDSKFVIIRTGADQTVLKPNKNIIEGPIRILFYGSYQPSQGVYEIIKSANLLKHNDFEWTLIGKGQDRAKVEKYAKEHTLNNVNFIDTIPFNSLVNYMNQANVILGVFGKTKKTEIVIHNKIFQTLAMGRLLITKETPAVREILQNGKNVIFVNGSSSEIAKKLLYLQKNKVTIKKIADNGRKTFINNFSTDKVSSSAIAALKNLV